MEVVIDAFATAVNFVVVIVVGVVVGDSSVTAGVVAESSAIVVV